MSAGRDAPFWPFVPFLPFLPFVPFARFALRALCVLCARRPLHGLLSRVAPLLLGTAAAAAAAAGNDADVRRMIDSLRAPPPAAAASPARAPAPATAASAGRTRNLVIEAVTAPAPSAAPAPGQAPAPSTPAPAAAGPAAAPAAAGPAAAPSLSLAIVFEPNSAQLRPESGDLLGSLVAAMLSAELRSQRFVIEGHTDASGSPAQNLRLSRERAEQVRLYLVTLGVAGERLSAVGKGASEPVNAADPRAAENRRVRVVVTP